MGKSKNHESRKSVKKFKSLCNHEYKGLKTSICRSDGTQICGICGKTLNKLGDFI
jgi:hypothetical protein